MGETADQSVKQTLTHLIEQLAKRGCRLETVSGNGKLSVSVRNQEGQVVEDFILDIHPEKTNAATENATSDDELPTLASFKGILPNTGLDSVEAVRALRDADWD